MARFIHRVTYLTYTLFFVSILLLGLSIATLILQSKVSHVFRNLQVQIPGSNLVEWVFVSLSPPNLDTGPTIAILVTGACGVVSGVVASGWVGACWGGWEEWQVNTGESGSRNTVFANEVFAD